MRNSASDHADKIGCGGLTWPVRHYMWSPLLLGGYNTSSLPRV